MPGHYIDTPQTAAGDTLLTNGLGNLDGISPEKSFVSPSKDHGAARQLRNGIRNVGLNVKTPRPGTREALRLLPNGNGMKPEFTPLLKSVTKNNALRRTSSKKSGVPETPFFLKEGYNSNGATPLLPGFENSQLTGTTSSSIEELHNTSMPNGISSSAQSTPLAKLPARDGRGGFAGDGNMMTLREQEHIIDKIEKENFNLKMKIHFLEEAMSKRGPEFNHAALKENTDLKVNRITMQRELHKFKKSIAQAEHDAEVYRLQLEDYRERMKRKQADESVRVEIERLQVEVQSKETEIEELRTKLQLAQERDDQKLEKLRDEIGDLEADVREKDRVIEQHEGEAERLKEAANKDSDAAVQLEEELEAAQKQVEDLQEEHDQAVADAKEAKEECEAAMYEKRKAEEKLDELQDEMVNKSFTTKGLSQQLKEKADDLEDQLNDLKEQYTQLRQEHSSAQESERELLGQLHNLQTERTVEQRRLNKSVNDLKQERDTLKRELEGMSTSLEKSRDELRYKTEEKDLLQTRHDALTLESSDLQRDLSKAQSTIEELEKALKQEQHHAAHNDNYLRTQHKLEVDLLTEQIDSLHQEVNAKDGSLLSRQDEWESQRRTLEAASKRAEEKALGLQRTVDKLQETKGTLSSRETKLQEVLESEKHRHKQEEEILNKQLQSLNDDLAAKREASDANRIELSNAKEELRISIRDQAALREKVEQLEEEIEVLQANLEEEADYAEQQKKKSVDNIESQLQAVRRERQSLQDQLANVNIELHNTKRAVREAESDRDDLSVQLKARPTRNSPPSSPSAHQEARELRRAKQALERELDGLKVSNKTLISTNKSLETEVAAEMSRAAAEEDRLNTEIARLSLKQFPSSDSRELTSSRSKIQRLESQIQDLEELLQSRTMATAASPSNKDVDRLSREVSEARKRETELLEKDSKHQSTARDLRAQILNLESQIHDLQVAKVSAKSPSISPPANRELREARKDLLDTRSQLRDLKSQNRELERKLRSTAVESSERQDLHELVKTSTLEAETLELRLRERDDQVREMRKDLRRIREERDAASQRADAAGREERLEEERRHKAKERELGGLTREIQWLRAQLKREEGFRRDLAWSKGLMEVGEGVRSAWLVLSSLFDFPFPKVMLT